MLVEKYEEREKLEDKAKINEDIKKEIRDKIEKIRKEMPEEIKAHCDSKDYEIILNKKSIRVNFFHLDLALFAYWEDRTIQFDRKFRIDEKTLDLMILLRKSFHEIF